MKLLMYRHNDAQRLGALQDETVIDLVGLGQAEGVTLPPTLLRLIEAGPEALASVRSLLSAAGGKAGQAFGQPLDRVEVLAPLDPPRGNIVCVGRNYLEHAQESARARGETLGRPTVFTKAQTTINGPYDDITIPSALTQQMDWEAELGVVIGRTALDVPRERALEYVFGYTVVNDISARDVQYGWGGQFFKGKSFNGFCPVGPCIVTADEAPDPQALRVRLRVNGETRQDANTADMIFPVDDLIAQLSQGMTLPAGTLIATGTPAGVGMGREPQVWLQPGDIMETEIEGLGLLRNRLVAG